MADLSGIGRGQFPTFDTGHVGWNSALGTLAQGLFPDPMRGAQAFAAGAQARNDIIKSDVATSEMAAGQNALAMIMAMSGNNPGMAPPAPTYRQSGVPGGPQIMLPPGAPAGGGGLAATVAPGGAPPTPLPSPTQAYDAMGAGSEHNPIFAGKPSPASPPVNGAPPAPNTTGSDGSIPNDQTQGMLHPASVQPPGGGLKQSGPANPDGSPARTPLNLGTYVAMQAAAGRNAEMAKVQGMAWLTQAYQSGIIDKTTFAQLSSGVGNNAMYESDQATQRTGMTVAGELERTKLTEAGHSQRTGLDTVTIGGPGGPRVATKGYIAGQGGNVPGYDSQVAVQENRPVQVYQNGADGRPDVEKPPRMVTAQQAREQSLTPTPATREEALAGVQGGAVYGTTGGAPRRLADVVSGQNAAAQPPANADEAAKAMQLRDVITERTYPVPDQRIAIAGTRFEPSRLTQEAMAVLSDVASEVHQRNPRLDRAAAEAQAMEQMQNDGLLPRPEQVKQARGRSIGNFWGNPAIDAQAGRGTTKDAFAIPLMKDYRNARTGANVRASPNQAGAGGAGTPTPGGAPTGSIGVAPAGAKDGTKVQKGNQIGVVRNGFIYPQ